MIWDWSICCVGKMKILSWTIGWFCETIIIMGSSTIGSVKPILRWWPRDERVLQRRNLKQKWRNLKQMVLRQSYSGIWNNCRGIWNGIIFSECPFYCSLELKFYLTFKKLFSAEIVLVYLFLLRLCWAAYRENLLILSHILIQYVFRAEDDNKKWKSYFLPTSSNSY